ncbi:MAG: hypothetical protein IBJ00_05965 [Alphaproteobacteria bacterium]|nr:hypothetical protein [Alphaproteobacteria bacterium]
MNNINLKNTQKILTYFLFLCAYLYPSSINASKEMSEEDYSKLKFNRTLAEWSAPSKPLRPASEIIEEAKQVIGLLDSKYFSKPQHAKFMREATTSEASKILFNLSMILKAYKLNKSETMQMSNEGPMFSIKIDPMDLAALNSIIREEVNSLESSKEKIAQDYIEPLLEISKEVAFYSTELRSAKARN